MISQLHMMKSHSNDILLKSDHFSKHGNSGCLQYFLCLRNLHFFSNKIFHAKRIVIQDQSDNGASTNMQMRPWRILMLSQKLFNTPAYSVTADLFKSFFTAIHMEYNDAGIA